MDFDKLEAEQAKIRAVIAERVNWHNEESAKEAWALMIYVCDHCQHKERIWNARPHVTPFGGIPCQLCGGDMPRSKNSWQTIVARIITKSYFRCWAVPR